MGREDPQVLRPDPFDHVNWMRRRALSGAELRILEKLKAQREAGELSDAEFEAARATAFGYPSASRSTVPLTPAQRELYDETNPHGFAVADGQTLEQARNVAAYAFRDVCMLELGDPP